MRRLRIALIALAVLAIPGSTARAHEFDPHIVHVRERGKGSYTVRWTAPVPTQAQMQWPSHCAAEVVEAAERWRTFRVECGEAGLGGSALSVEGLDSPREHVLLDMQATSGRRWQHVLRGDDDAVEVPMDAASAGVLQTAASYLWLGVEHLLFGADHVLFVLGLLGLIQRRSTLIQAATAFTVGHALTLCLSTLGLVQLRSAPVEACIALSLVWLAREILRPNPAALSRRAPWLAAGGFGLLHGLGFAGALAELGVPDGQAAVALASFNVGIELGQLAVIVVALAVMRATRGWSGRAWVDRYAPYGMGAIATAWVISRSLSVLVP